MTEIEDMLKKTFFIVEATSFEQLCLWQQHSSQSAVAMFDTVTWKQLLGLWAVVGTIDNRLITVNFQWVDIDGKLVCFVNPTSQLVDHEMIDEWIDERFSGKWDNGTRTAKTDAMNFGHCINAIKDSSNLLS